MSGVMVKHVLKNAIVSLKFILSHTVFFHNYFLLVLVSSISPTFFILKLHVLYFTVPLLSFLLRSQVLIFQCPRKRYLATWMQHLLQKDSKVFRYGNTVPVAVVWSKRFDILKKNLLSNVWMETGGQEHWRWERKGLVGRGANVVDPLYPNMGIHILHTVSLYILFCADKENLFTYQVQCTLLIGNYILCSYWFSSDTVLRNWMQVTPSHVRINDGVDLDASLKQKKNQIRGNLNNSVFW